MKKSLGAAAQGIRTKVKTSADRHPVSKPLTARSPHHPARQEGTQQNHSTCQASGTQTLSLILQTRKLCQEAKIPAGCKLVNCHAGARAGCLSQDLLMH